MLALTFALAVLGQPTTVTARVTPDLTTVNQLLDDWVAAEQIDGAGLMVMRGDEVLLEHAAGTHTLDTELAIASASKWLTTATVLSVVGDGKLGLDDRVAQYLPAFRDPPLDAITLRQCLSCTSGLPARAPGLFQRNATMDGVVRRIADGGVEDPPGTALRYGGAGFQVAARVAEVVTGKDWDTLFDERIRQPLHLRQTRYGSEGSSRVPFVGGGGRSTAREYIRFVAMLAARGRCEQTQIIPAELVDEMFRDAIDGLAIASTPYDDGGVIRYGLGTWIERKDASGKAMIVSDTGAFGFTPWIDRDLGVCGVFAVQDRLPRTLPTANAIRARIREILGGVDPAPASPPRSLPPGDHDLTIEHGGRQRTAVLHVPPTSSEAARALVVVLHGGGGNARNAQQMTGFSDCADREDFLVVYPNGSGPLKNALLTWNSGGIPVYAVEHDVDDVGFVRALVAEIARLTPVDAQRVYATGMSNGGMMAHRLAHDAADLFAAIADVAGAMNYTARDPARSLAVLMIHGRADEHVLYAGGRPRQSVGESGDREDTSVAAAAAYYAARFGLTGTPTSTSNGTLTIDTWCDPQRPDAGEVRVISIDGEGHTWPGGPVIRRRADPPTDAFDATAAIWRFFADHPRQP